MANTSFHQLEHGLRNNQQYPLYVYKVGCTAGKNAIHAHWNEETEMLLMEHDGTIEIDTQAIDYRCGDVVFITKGQLHKATAHTDGHYYAILFPETFLDFKSGDLCQTEILDPLKSGRLVFPCRLTKGDPAYEEVEDCLRELIALYFGQEPGRKLKMKACLYDILFWCYNKGAFDTAATPRPALQNQPLLYVKAAISYLEEHFADAITLDELAGRVGIHKHYLEALFHQITGMTPIVYLRRLRLEQSISALELGATVTQAALASGFNNVSYYIRCFQSVYGVSPKRYAARVR
ncbi:MAG: helix-turn-helix domain-containing protein [Acutalibacteraceae bacterium]|jgi:AraC-like DNA-binding protein